MVHHRNHRNWSAVVFVKNNVESIVEVVFLKFYGSALRCGGTEDCQRREGGSISPSRAWISCGRRSRSIESLPNFLQRFGQARSHLTSMWKNTTFLLILLSMVVIQETLILINMVL